MSVNRRGKQNMWYMNFTVNGKRIYRSTKTTSKKIAKQIEATEKQRLMQEVKVTPQEKAARTLLKDAIELTYNSKWKNNKDATGTHRKAYRLLELIGNISVGDIDEEVVYALISKLESKGIVGATINRYQSTLKTILKHMKQPAEIFKPRKERRGRIRVISRGEEQTVLKLLRESQKPVSQEVADLMICLIDSGCRLSEMLNLLYQDIDYPSNHIRIWTNKGDRPRSVSMTSRVRAILEARQIVNPLKPFTVTKFQADRCWAGIRKQMGLEEDREFVIHAARHTFASRLLNKGVDLATIRDLLGHASILITERVYAHLCPTRLAHAVSLLEED